MNQRQAKVECTIPILPVANLANSAKFYIDELQFALDWGDPQKDSICSVSRDGQAIMLMAASGPVTPTWVWIGIDHDALFDELRAQQVKVRQEPKNFPWAYEMKFEDIDGNVLWIGTERREDLPLDGGT